MAQTKEYAMAPSSTQVLASYLADFSLDHLSPESLQKTRHCVLDYLASAWNGQGHCLTASYRELALELGGAGEFPVIGGGKTTAVFAAFGNGALGHITEVDDIHRKATMHAGICVMPVAFAMAQELGLDGKRMLESIVCGYEAALRVGTCLGRTHYVTFHTTATAGTFGAAAAAAKALGLDAQKTAHALGHAGTQAAGLWQFLDDKAATAKALHPGKAAMNGIIAAKLAAKGIPAATHILEGKKGFFAFATTAPDLDAVTRDFGKPYCVDDVCFKSYPACGQIISMLDATRTIMREHNVTADDVAEVESHVYQQALNIAANPDPRSLEEAKFSNQVCTAFMLVNGDLTFGNFTEQGIHDPRVRELASRVKLVFNEEIDAKFPATRPCRIIIRTKSGREFVQENYYRTGDPERPMTWDQVRGKFCDLSSHALSKERQNAIIDWCAKLPETRLDPVIFEKG